MTKRWTIIVLGVIQSLVTAILPILALGGAMRDWDTGSAPSGLSMLLSGSAEILRFPIATPFFSTPLGQLFPGVLGYVPLLLNGLLWAWVIVTLIYRWKARRTRSGVVA